ncbi:MAG: hypothetical protein U1F81_24360 [Verrucomicrobiaceae bacterium]
MTTLRLTLFIIGNVLFFSQLARDLHHLVWGVETSVFDEFNPERNKARSEASFTTLLDEYRKTRIQTDALEKTKTWEETQQLRKEHKELYERHEELRSEIAQREQMSRELRDTWAYSGFAIALIFLGFMCFHRQSRWTGVALTLSGFTILEYWASPLFFGGAPVEFRALLWTKTFLTVVALALLYVAGRGVVGRSVPN